MHLISSTVTRLSNAALAVIKFQMTVPAPNTTAKNTAYTKLVNRSSLLSSFSAVDADPTFLRMVSFFTLPGSTSSVTSRPLSAMVYAVRSFTL